MDQVSRALLMAGGAAEATDPQFNYVTLLLKGNGTNGAQNNAFLDSSSNNYGITQVGNATQGSFSPYLPNWSNYFDGSASYLYTPNNAAFDFGTGDFTIECFAYLSSGPAFAMADGAGDDLAAYQGTLASNGGKFVVYYPGIGNFVSTPVTINSWVHVAVSRGSGTLRVFMNGVLIGSPTSDSKNWTSNRRLHIGSFSSGASAIGYVSNVRVLNGTALYTAAFTPPISPLTAITNTSLLTCQSNGFIDNSSNAFALSKENEVSIERFTPFAPGSPYSAAAFGGSGCFDGTGDYLSINGTYTINGDVTIEGWMYHAGISTNGYNTVYAFAGGALSMQWTGSTLACYVGSTGGAGELGWTPSGATNARRFSRSWVHFAVVRSGTSWALFINGTRVSTATNSTTFSISSSTKIGIDNGTAYPMRGFIADFRLTNGTARYNPSSTTITVPTAPVPPSGSTLALQFTNAGVIDNAMMNDLETVGDAQISTSASKFGSGSMYFNATTSACLLLRPSVNLAFGSEDFTVEFWVNGPSGQSTITGGDYPNLLNIGYYSTPDLKIWTSGGTTINFSGLAGSMSGTKTVLDGTWHHVAVTCASGTTSVFVDGILDVTASRSSPLTSALSYGSAIGSNGGPYGPGAGRFQGYIDDLRITKGVARYIANFTPPDSLPTR